MTNAHAAVCIYGAVIKLYTKHASCLRNNNLVTHGKRNTIHCIAQILLKKFHNYS